MNKQDKIMAGVDKIMLDTIGDDEGVIARDIMGYLQSQGVVIKVKGELPLIPKWWTKKSINCAELVQQDMIKAGYTLTEPLIKAGKK